VLCIFKLCNVPFGFHAETIYPFFFPSVINALPVYLFVTWSIYSHFVNSECYEVPHYEVFPSALPFHRSYAWIFSSALSSLISSGYVNLLHCCVELDLLVAVLVTNVTIFWDIPPCCPHVSLRFGATHHLHLQGWKSTTKPRVTSWFPTRLIFDHEDGSDTFLRNFGSDTEGRNGNFLQC
jgi:hypothetical protein